MVDLNRDAERSRARKAMKREVLALLHSCELKDQCEILIDALTDVEDLLNGASVSGNVVLPAEQKIVGQKQDPSPDDDAAAGPTELILAILAEASPKLLKAETIIADAR